MSDVIRLMLAKADECELHGQSNEAFCLREGVGEILELRMRIERLEKFVGYIDVTRPIMGMMQSIKGVHY